MPPFPKLIQANKKCIVQLTKSITKERKVKKEESYIEKQQA